MAILSIQPFALDSKPQLLSINTDDSYATVITEGYLSDNGSSFGVTFTGEQNALVYTTDRKAIICQIHDSGGGVISLRPSCVNLMSFDVTVTHSQLVGFTAVQIMKGFSSLKFYIREMMIVGEGVDFGGIGASRDLEITDGVTIYSVIPAASLSNASTLKSRWGDSSLPFPASAQINQMTAAGQPLYCVYSGGLLDYTSGSINLTGMLEISI